MSRKNRKPIYTLSQDEAERLIAEVKNSVEKLFVMPAAGERNAEFHVLGDDGEKFTIAVFKGAINADRHSMSARITRLGVPLLRLCVNGSTHTNPDGERISGTHWHIYKEGEDDWNAQTADIESPGLRERYNKAVGQIQRHPQTGLPGETDMNETTATDELIAEYGEWLKRESSVRNVGEWREVTLPFLDRSNDDLCFYVRTTDGVTSFTDDGYTMASFDLNGVTITESRRERINRLALRFGAMVGDDGQITLETEGSRPDAMNRFVQALTDIGSMLETSQKRVLSYFADDVALKLDSCQVFYTPNVGIRGVSSYEHSFDFLFQRSANHPTRFCQAPNRFDKDAVKDIMFGWDDTKKDPKRRDSRLIVIGDDRQTPLQRGALTAFRNYGVTVIPYSKLEERAPVELAA